MKKTETESCRNTVMRAGDPYRRAALERFRETRKGKDSPVLLVATMANMSVGRCKTTTKGIAASKIAFALETLLEMAQSDEWVDDWECIVAEILVASRKGIGGPRAERIEP